MTCRHQQLKQCFCGKRQSFSVNVIEVFTLTTELVEEPVARAPNGMESDVVNAAVPIADTLKRAHENPQKAKVLLAKTTEGQKDVKSTRNQKIVMVQEEPEEKIVVWKAVSPESQMTF